MMAQPVAAENRREEKCCFCMSMRGGTIAIGCFYSIVAVLVVILCLFLLVEDWSTPRQKSTAADTTTDAAYVLGIILIFIKILMALLVVYGGIKKEPKYLKPWIIYAVILVVIAKAATIYFFIKFYSGDRWVYGNIAVLILNSTLLLYFIYVVNRYRTSLQEEVNGENTVEGVTSNALLKNSPGTSNAAKEHKV